MIASLTGAVQAVTADQAVIDVGGVGYLVNCSSRTLAALGPPGSSVMLLTDMQVSDDAIRLFGFATVEERDWYRLLTGVQGVGGRVALAILSVLSAGEIADAVRRADKAMVARANGVGPKLAQRIVNELKDKVGAGAALGPASAAPPGSSAEGDALSALANLGFKPAEASRAVAAAAEELGVGATFDALVRLSLRKAGR
jgi:Holliday junction DNA helicase RuvA